MSIQRVKNLGSSFTSFWAVYAFTSFSDGFRRIAVLLWVYEVSGKDGVAVAGIMLAEIAPRVMLGPFMGVWVDRLGSKRMLAYATAAMAAVSLLQAGVALFGLGVPIMLALVLLGAVTETAATPASGAIVPALVHEDQLQSANAVLSSTYQAALIVGPPLGAYIYGALGRPTVFVIDAIVLAVAWLLVQRLQVTVAKAQEPDQHFFDQLLSGLDFMMKNKPLLALGYIFVLFSLAVGMSNTAMIFFIEDLGAKAANIAWLGAANGIVQVLAAGVIIAAAHRLTNTRSLLGIGLAIMIMGNLGRALAPNFWLLIAAVVLTSIGNSPYNIAFDTLKQVYTPRNLLGRVESVLDVTGSVFFLVGSGISGVLLGHLTPRSLMYLALGVSALAALAFPWVKDREG